MSSKAFCWNRQAGTEQFIWLSARNQEGQIYNKISARLCAIFINAALAIVSSLLLLSQAQASPNVPTIVSLDGCADQYVLGLVPRAQILALSDRSRLADSYFRDRAAGIRRTQPRLETLLALHPDIVVRTWGGDPKLIQRLTDDGITVVNIKDSDTFDQAHAELIRIGHRLGQDASARIEAHNLDTALDQVKNVGKGRSVLYYTPSGFTAGKGGLIADMLRRLGFRIDTQIQYDYLIPPEALLSMKPDVFALGFYEDRYAMRRVPGRNPLVRNLIANTPHFTLPMRAISCSGWFTAYDLRDLSQYGIR